METFLTIISSIIIGAGLAFLITNQLMHQRILKSSKSNFDFDETLNKLNEELEKGGWKIPHIHDMQETMRKFGKEVMRVKIYEVCMPHIAYEILSRDDERIVSSLMPCRISVYEATDGGVWISRMNGNRFGSFFKGVARRFMTNAGDDIEKVLSNIIAK